MSGGGRILEQDDPFADLIPEGKAKPPQGGDADPFQDLIPKPMTLPPVVVTKPQEGTVTVSQPKGVVGGRGETLIPAEDMTKVARGEYGLAPQIDAAMRLGRNRQGYQNIGNVDEGEAIDKKRVRVTTAYDREQEGSVDQLAADVEGTRPVPGLKEDLARQHEALPKAVARAVGVMLSDPGKTAFDIVSQPARAGYDLGEYAQGGGSGRDAAFGVLQTAALLMGGPSERWLHPIVASVVGDVAAPAVTQSIIGSLAGATFSPDRPAVGAVIGGAAGVASGALSARGIAAEKLQQRIARFEQMAKEHPDWVGESTPAGTESRSSRLLENPNRPKANASIVDEPPPGEGPDYTVEDPIAELGPFKGALVEHGRHVAAMPDAVTPAASEGPQPTAPQPVTADNLPPKPVRLAAGVRAPAGEVVSVPGKSLHLDPARFQFKHQGIDASSGAAPWVKGAKRYNPVMGGVWVTWIDPADGKEYVVNSHHRHAIWKNDISRDRPENVNVLRIDADNAQEARAIGARINIAEGHGTPLDVAQFIRDSGLRAEDLEREGISLRGDLAQKGSALAQLAPDLLAKVGTGEINETHGVAIGDMLAGEPELQREVVGEVSRAKARLSADDVREVARQVKAAGAEEVRQETLFGGEVGRKPLFVERARVASSILKKLGADRRVLGFVADQNRADILAKGGNVIDVERSRELADQSAQLEELFQRLYTRDGPIAKLLTQAAGRVARGEQVRSVADAIYADVAAAVQAEIARGVGGGADHGEAEGEGSVSPGATEAAGLTFSFAGAKTGKPFTVRTFRGEGGGNPKYSEFSAGVPILGNGRYGTPNRSFAEHFGAVTEHTAHLENPLVITDDAQWRELTREAGWKFPNPVGLPKEEAVAGIDRLREVIEDMGHDGVVVRISPEGDVGKTLRNVFDSDTIVEFNPTNDNFVDPDQEDVFGVGEVRPEYRAKRNAVAREKYRSERGGELERDPARKKELGIAEYHKSANLANALDAAGVGYTQWSRWRSMDPDFKERTDAVKRRHADNTTGRALRRRKADENAAANAKLEEQLRYYREQNKASRARHAPERRGIDHRSPEATAARNERKKTAIEVYELTGSKTAAAKEAGILRTRFNHWIDQDPEFRKRVTAADRKRIASDIDELTDHVAELRATLDRAGAFLVGRQRRAFNSEAAQIMKSIDGLEALQKARVELDDLADDFMPLEGHEEEQRQLHKQLAEEERIAGMKRDADMDPEAEAHRARQARYEAKKQEAAAPAAPVSDAVARYRAEKEAHAARVRERGQVQEERGEYSAGIHMAIFDSKGVVESKTRAELDAVDNHHSLAFSEKALARGEKGAMAWTNDGKTTTVVAHAGSEMSDKRIYELVSAAGLPTEKIKLIQVDARGEEDEQRTITAAPKHDYSSTQVELPKETANAIKDLAATIPDEDLAADGRENNPHVTIKYGLHTTDPRAVEKLLRNEGPIELVLGKTSFFPNGESNSGDVLKADVDSPDLHRLNRLIGGNLKTTDTHPLYTPHATIAYLKPGLGQKYAGDTSLQGKRIVVDKITFSSKDGTQHVVKLEGKQRPRGKQQERIISAAIRLANGKVVRGLSHYNAFSRAVEQGLISKEVEARALEIGGPPASPDFEDGFATTHREFVTREEAYVIAEDAGQLQEDAEGQGFLGVEDLKGELGDFWLREDLFGYNPKPDQESLLPEDAGKKSNAPKPAAETMHTQELRARIKDLEEAIQKGYLPNTSRENHGLKDKGTLKNVRRHSATSFPKVILNQAGIDALTQRKQSLQRELRKVEGGKPDTGFKAKAKDARQEAAFLRKQLARMEKDPKYIGHTGEVRRRIADLERIANFAEKVKTEEVQTRAAIDNEGKPAGPDDTLDIFGEPDIEPTKATAAMAKWREMAEAVLADLEYQAVNNEVPEDLLSEFRGIRAAMERVFKDLDKQLPAIERVQAVTEYQHGLMHEWLELADEYRDFVHEVFSRKSQDAYRQLLGEYQRDFFNLEEERAKYSAPVKVGDTVNFDVRGPRRGKIVEQLPDENGQPYFIIHQYRPGGVERHKVGLARIDVLSGLNKGSVDEGSLPFMEDRHTPEWIRNHINYLKELSAGLPSRRAKGGAKKWEAFMEFVRGKLGLPTHLDLGESHLGPRAKEVRHASRILPGRDAFWQALHEFWTDAGPNGRLAMLRKWRHLSGERPLKPGYELKVNSELDKVDVYHKGELRGRYKSWMEAMDVAGEPELYPYWLIYREVEDLPEHVMYRLSQERMEMYQAMRDDLGVTEDRKQLQQLDRAGYDASARDASAQLELTFGSKAKAADVAADVVKHSGKYVTVAHANELGQKVLSARQRLKNVEAAKARGAFVSLKGKKFKGPHELAQLMYPFRSPEAEHFHVFYVNTDGEIVSHTLDTSGAINYVLMAKNIADRIAETAGSLGVTTVDFGHNHPSGNVTGSTMDKKLTVQIHNELEKRGIKLRSHVIINHNVFTWIRPTESSASGGSIEIAESVPFDPPAWAEASDWTQGHGAVVRDPWSLANVTTGGIVHGMVGFVYVTSNLQVVALEPRLPSAIADLHKWLPEQLKALAADQFAIVYDPKIHGNVIDQVRQIAKLHPELTHNLLDVSSFDGSRSIRAEYDAELNQLGKQVPIIPKPAKRLLGEERRPYGGSSEGREEGARESESEAAGADGRQSEDEGRVQRSGRPAQLQDPQLERSAGKLARAWVSVQRLLRPAGITRESAAGARDLRHALGRLAHRNELASHALRQFSRELTRLSPDDRLAFIHGIETGEYVGGPEMIAAAKQLRAELDAVRDRVIALGTGKLRSFIEDYFPHIWKDPKRARTLIQQMMQRRPFEGNKSWLKKRTLPTTKDGIAIGLEPITDNPLDLALLRIYQMNKYVMAHEVMRDWKARGPRFLKFVGAHEQLPVGYRYIDDSAFTVFGRPAVPVEEAFDPILRNHLLQILKGLGGSHERLLRLGSSQRLGSASPTGEVKTKFGSDVGVLMHEIGHILDFKYKLYDKLHEPIESREIKRGKKKGKFVATNAAIKHRKKITRELRELADLRMEGMHPDDVSAHAKKYVREKEEKIANAMHALVYMPDRMQQVAPTVKRALEDFLRSTPAASGMLSLRKSVVLTSAQKEAHIYGTLTVGRYAAPEALATVMNNYLSPGLRGNPLYDAYMAVGNSLNQVQLGLSFFHLGFTSIDAMVSKLALSFQQLARGQFMDAGASMVLFPAAWVTNYVKGFRVYRAYLKGNAGEEFDRIVEGIERAGGKIKMDDFYRNDHWKKLVEGWYHHDPITVIARIIPSAFELSSRIILEHVVPRQKLGVFADMFMMEAKRLGVDATEDELNRAAQRAWDSTDNRMGQMVYDNLMWNRMLKDVLMGLVRAVGWDLGTFRELIGGAYDLARLPDRGLRRLRGDRRQKLLGAGGGGRVVNLRDAENGGEEPDPGDGRPDPLFTHKAAYVIALFTGVGLMGAALNKAMTGEWPQDQRDVWTPRTGKTNDEGNPERVELPSYVKDVFAYWRHGVRTALHKLHPLLNYVASVLQNEDYYGNMIQNPEDPRLTRFKQELEYAINQVQPFGVRNAAEQAKRNQSPLVGAGNFIGITPAHRESTRTPAQNKMAEFNAKKGRAGLTPEEAQERQIRGELRGAKREGKPKGTAIAEAMRGRRSVVDKVIGLDATPFSHRDANRIWNATGRDASIEQFKRLEYPEAVLVMKVANPDERRRWHAAMVQKREAYRISHGAAALRRANGQ